MSPQPLGTPPRRGDSARAAFFPRVQGCCWPHSPCLTVECGWASWGWDTLKSENKCIVQVLFSPKGFKSVLGVGWRTHGQNRQCRIPGHPGDWAALSTLHDNTCPPHSRCHQPHLECVYLCVRARAPTHNNLYYSFNPNLKIQPKPPKCPLYTNLRGLMGPRKTRPGRKQPSRRQTQQLLFWACGRISRLSRKPRWMKATVSLHVPMEHRSRFCTLFAHPCCQSFCLGKPQTRTKRNVGFKVGRPGHTPLYHSWLSDLGRGS